MHALYNVGIMQYKNYAVYALCSVGTMTNGQTPSLLVRLQNTLTFFKLIDGTRAHII